MRFSPKGMSYFTVSVTYTKAVLRQSSTCQLMCIFFSDVCNSITSPSLYSAAYTRSTKSSPWDAARVLPSLSKTFSDNFETLKNVIIKLIVIFIDIQKVRNSFSSKKQFIIIQSLTRTLIIYIIFNSIIILIR